MTFRENDSVKENKVSFKLLEVKRIAVDHKMAARLVIPEGTKVFMIKRLLNSENGPAGIDVKYLPYKKGKPLLEKEIEYADFPEIVAKHTDATIHKIEMGISATPLIPEEAELLKTVTGHPALCVIQVIYAKDGHPLGICFNR